MTQFHQPFLYPFEELPRHSLLDLSQKASQVFLISIFQDMFVLLVCYAPSDCHFGILESFLHYNPSINRSSRKSRYTVESMHTLDSRVGCYNSPNKNSFLVFTLQTIDAIFFAKFFADIVVHKSYPKLLGMHLAFILKYYVFP